MLSRPQPAHRPLPFIAALLALALWATPGTAQERSRIHAGSLGSAQLDLPGVTMVQVGPLGGGLGHLEARRPDLAPLAERFRVQRRTGIALGLVALAGGVIAFNRFADMDQPTMELGEPESNIMIAALGAMTLSIVQLEASGRTLRAIADRF